MRWGDDKTAQAVFLIGESIGERENMNSSDYEFLRSNEIVFIGHPDKIADQISDNILAAYLNEDIDSRVAVETCCGKYKIFITGEITSKAHVDKEKIVKDLLKYFGYNPSEWEVIDNTCEQSRDIALGVNETSLKEMGAGDQGICYGYAFSETKEYMPIAQVILQRLSRAYTKLFETDSRFKSDGKAQITGYYDKSYRLLKIKTFLCSYQNTEKERDKTDKILKDIIDDICKDFNIEIEEYLFNPTGRFEIGGILGDSGLTGRKLLIDNYHTFGQVGGGAFSSKDMTKVDRSGAYIAREIAVKYLEELNARMVEVEIGYSIGLPKPLSIRIKYYDTKENKNKFKIPTEEDYEMCKVGNIVKRYNDIIKKNPNWIKEICKYGHFTKREIV